MLYKGTQKLIGETLTIEKIKAALYPVGSVIISETERDLDSEIVGSHWVLEEEGRFIEATTVLTDVGTTVEDGLPNITGDFGSRGFTDDDFFYTGAFGLKNRTSRTSQSYGTNQTKGFDFDASRCSNIYGNSDKVQPKARKYLIYRRIS